MNAISVLCEIYHFKCNSRRGTGVRRAMTPVLSDLIYSIHKDCENSAPVPLAAPMPTARSRVPRVVGLAGEPKQQPTLSSGSSPRIDTRFGSPQGGSHNSSKGRSFKSASGLGSQLVQDSCRQIFLRHPAIYLEPHQSLFFRCQCNHVDGFKHALWYNSFVLVGDTTRLSAVPPLPFSRGHRTRKDNPKTNNYSVTIA